jgi:hypothetical protein
MKKLAIALALLSVLLGIGFWQYSRINSFRFHDGSSSNTFVPVPHTDVYFSERFLALIAIGLLCSIIAGAILIRRCNRRKHAPNSP